MEGWAVILVSALLVLLAREGRGGFVCVGFVPVLVFWGLDGYFLSVQANLVGCNVFQNAGSLPPRVGPCGRTRDDDQAELIRALA